jgi:hypothetical protein
VYLRSREPAPAKRYITMNTLRPFGVTFTPKPGTPASQYTVSFDGTGKSSMTDFVSRKRGIAAPVLLP